MYSFGMDLFLLYISHIMFMIQPQKISTNFYNITRPHQTCIPHNALQPTYNTCHIKLYKYPNITLSQCPYSYNCF